MTCSGRSRAASPRRANPFNARAKGASSGEGEAAWADLLKAHKARGNNEFHTGELSSALLPGVQSASAEAVPFEGRVEQTILLHFWSLTTLLFVPNVLDADGSSKFVGYTLAVPEVGDLPQFVADYPKLLSAVSARPHGFRPAGAVIDIAAEGGLAFLDRLGAVAGQTLEDGTLQYSVRSVEYLHLVKDGNNVKTMAAGRVSPNPTLLGGYRSIVNPAPAREPVFRNPLFRRGLLLALLDGEPWYRPFGDVFAKFDVEAFLRQPRRSDDPAKQGPPQFAIDAARKLQYETQTFIQRVQKMATLPEAERPKTATPLSVIVNRVVRSYLNARSSEKAGVNLDQHKGENGEMDWKKIPAEFSEAKLKLALGLIMEFRSRREQAFTAHFAATFFSVTQRVSEPDRLELADALLGDERRDDLKTLTLMALSANS